MFRTEAKIFQFFNIDNWVAWLRNLQRKKDDYVADASEEDITTNRKTVETTGGSLTDNFTSVDFPSEAVLIPKCIREGKQLIVPISTSVTVCGVHRPPSPQHGGISWWP